MSRSIRRMAEGWRASPPSEADRGEAGESRHLATQRYTKFWENTRLPAERGFDLGSPPLRWKMMAGRSRSASATVAPPPMIALSVPTECTPTRAVGFMPTAPQPEFTGQSVWRYNFPRPNEVGLPARLRRAHRRRPRTAFSLDDVHVRHDSRARQSTLSAGRTCGGDAIQAKCGCT